MRVLILLALLGAAVALPKNSQRIVGGSPTNVESYPFMSNMQRADLSGIVWHQGCGGSLITANTVLSAAHCFFDEPPPWFWRVRLGTSLRSSGGTVHNVWQLVLHPQFNEATFDNDIAIVRLANSATFSASVAVASIAGPNYNLADGTVVTAIGWGTLFYMGPYSEQLQHVDINIISQSYCRSQYASLQVVHPTIPDITDNMLCAGIQHVGGKDACTGDSGGPLLHNGNVLVGITSWGYDCAHPDFPGVNARVSRYTDWITSTA